MVACLVRLLALFLARGNFIISRHGLVSFIMFVVNSNGLHGGACKHSPDEVGPGEKTYLMKSSKAVAALRKVVFDKLWLNNLEFYVRFRLMFEVNK